MSAVLVALCCREGWSQVHSQSAASTSQPLVETAVAGSLAALPARGLAAALAEAGRIEVPSVDPREPLTIRAGQAARWTEGSYDVWHLTGGVRIAQGTTEAQAHEAVVWIEQDSGLPIAMKAGDDPDSAAIGGPQVRSILVRMAGDVNVRSQNGGAEVTAGETSSAAESVPTTLRGPRWAGRFWTLRDPTLDFT
ncbi:MAG: hypothetical protein WCQ91_04560, partial [Planctomycetota bacterium]